MKTEQQEKFLYTFVHHENEYDLCRMEMRAFFAKDTKSNYLFSDIDIDPSRSPFIQDRLEVFYKSEDLAMIQSFVKEINMQNSTYKVICLNKMVIGESEKIPHSNRREIERKIGLSIEGEPDLENPEIVFGLAFVENCWYFGRHLLSESVWRKHIHKPVSYSTALNTRVSRAIANIAVPFPGNIRAIDPCCGIGTVLIEALSMGINIEGRDIKPLVCVGARKNIAFFGLEGVVTKGAISDITEQYDVAIIDLPYNIYSHISREEQFDIIKQARRIANRVVIVTIETIDDMVEKSGFVIADRCITKKHLFVRQVLLCR